ncbi:MAG: hypothetical protein Crog4KO_14850 [Crocinitomicaceae bacterium]
MSNTKFFFKWVLPIAVLVLGFISIGSFVDSTFDKIELTKVNGRIQKIEYYESSSRGGSNTNMRLHLTNGDTFNITNEWEDKFDEVEDEFQKSDEIQLLHRNTNQTWWRLGSANSIYHLEIGGEVIIDHEERKSKSKMLGIFTGTMAFISLTLFIAHKNRLLRTRE